MQSHYFFAPVQNPHEALLPFSVTFPQWSCSTTELRAKQAEGHGENSTVFMLYAHVTHLARAQDSLSTPARALITRLQRYTLPPTDGPQLRFVTEQPQNSRRLGCLTFILRQSLQIWKVQVLEHWKRKDSFLPHLLSSSQTRMPFGIIYLRLCLP